MASETIRFLQSLGFRINEKKSRLQPGIHVVGSGLGLGFTQVVNSPSEEEGHCQTGKIVSQEDESYEKDARKGPGIPFYLQPFATRISR